MATPEEYSRTMTKRVLLKLDLYILPPLAMVSVSFIMGCRVPCMLQVVCISCGWPILLTGVTLETQGQFIPHLGRFHLKIFDRIAGLERDTHLHGTQFNTALAGAPTLFTHRTIF